MTTTVLLVRHGQTRSNVIGDYMGESGEDLTDVGYTQAHSLSSRLASLPIASVYSGSAWRTYATATILAKPHGLKVEVSDELGEIRQWAELLYQLKTGSSEPDDESLKQLTERVLRIFNKIVAANRGRQVLIVTHEHAVKVIVVHALGVPNSSYHRFKIDNGSLTTVQVTNGNLRLITLNDTSHLEA